MDSYMLFILVKCLYKIIEPLILRVSADHFYRQGNLASIAFSFNTGAPVKDSAWLGFREGGTKKLTKLTSLKADIFLTMNWFNQMNILNRCQRWKNEIKNL
jgi:hypothetical protein